MRSVDNAMHDDNEITLRYANLKRLAYEDPLEAKRQFLVVYDGDDTVLHAILALATEPGDGRLRQIVARAVQKRPDKARVMSTLERWRLTETDEFALTAINDVIEGNRTKTRRTKALDEVPDLATTYRYLAGRMRHRVLNILPSTGLSLEDLQRAILQLGDEAQVSHITSLLDHLKVSLLRLQRSMDFAEEEQYFARDTFLLIDWLKEYKQRFQALYGTIDLHLEFGEHESRALVEASHFSLETIFSNLWRNSQQAVCGLCKIKVVCRLNRSNLVLEFIDNGVGYPAQDCERAFHIQYSTKGGLARGRGHMEVADAVRRLQGSIEVKQIGHEGYRAVLTIPRTKL